MRLISKAILQQGGKRTLVGWLAAAGAGALNLLADGICARAQAIAGRGAAR